MSYKDSQRYRKVYSYYRPNPKPVDVFTVDKTYVDEVFQSFDWKQSARVCSPVDVSILPGITTIDGISLNDEDRVILTNQSDQSENGIYVWYASSQTLQRSLDSSQDSLTCGAACYVEEGTYSGKIWILSTNDPITVGTTLLSWTEFGGGDGIFTVSSQYAKTTKSVSFDASNRYTNQLGSDVYFYVSGAIGSRNASSPGIALFGGDLVVSGTTDLIGDALEVTGSLLVTGSAKFRTDRLEVTGTLLASNAIIAGDLIVNGTTTTVNTTNTVVKDAIIGLNFASGSVPQSNSDVGWIGANNGGNVASFWDDSSGEFVFARTTNHSSSSLPVPITSYLGLRAENILASVVTASVALYSSGTLSQGMNAQALGSYSCAQGNDSVASGISSHAEGGNTVASGPSSHAEGDHTTSSAGSSHAEGYQTTSTGLASHAEGNSTIASGVGSHAEGYQSESSGNYSHAEGYQNSAKGFSAHAEGLQTLASASYSHAEGFQTNASGSRSHAEGEGTIAYGVGSHSEGYYTIASGSYQLAIGQYNKRNNETSLFVIGNGTGDSDLYRSDVVRVEASGLQVTGSVSAATGLSGSLTKLVDGTSYLIAGSGINIVSASNGAVTISSTGGVGGGDITAVYAGTGLTGGGSSGDVTLNINDSVVATISGSTFSGAVKFNQGLSGSLTNLLDGTSYIIAGSGIQVTSQSNGSVTISSTGGGTQQDVYWQSTTTGITFTTGSAYVGHLSASSGFELTGSFVQGSSTVASGLGSHAEGLSTVAFGNYSHAEGLFTIASGSYQTVVGKFNKRNNNTSLFVVGNGTNDLDTQRSDALLVDSSGTTMSGTLKNVGPLNLEGNASVTGSVEMKGSIVPDADVTYTLGTSAKRWGHIYTGDLHLRNDRGDWTIVEEKDFLCVVNNITGKKYKMMLQPIDD